MIYAPSTNASVVSPPRVVVRVQWYCGACGRWLTDITEVCPCAWAGPVPPVLSRERQ